MHFASPSTNSDARGEMRSAKLIICVSRGCGCMGQDRTLVYRTVYPDLGERTFKSREVEF